jgi:hypothetical protein
MPRPARQAEAAEPGLGEAALAAMRPARKPSVKPIGPPWPPSARIIGRLVPIRQPAMGSCRNTATIF